jgi:hypothetical protein
MRGGHGQSYLLMMEKVMAKNLWQKERQALFRELVGQYQEEGYQKKKARKLARQEVNEIMEDKEDFVENILIEAFDDR